MPPTAHYKYGVKTVADVAAEAAAAEAQAKAEGLTLERGRGASGYKNVRASGSRWSVQVTRANKTVQLEGTFLTAEGAALAYAQRLAQENSCTWLGCDLCGKWRIVPKHRVVDASERWYHEMP